MDVEMNENTEELSFMASAGSNSVGMNPICVTGSAERMVSSTTTSRQCWLKGDDGEAAHDEPLQGMLQCEARRKEGAGCEQRDLEHAGR